MSSEGVSAVTDEQNDSGGLVPKLRFPEFWGAGEWKEKALGPNTIKVGSGITPTGGDATYTSSGRPFMRSQNVGWGNLILNNVAFIDEQIHATFPSTEIKAGDVLLNITGASIGRSAIADVRIAGGNVNQHVCIIRVNGENLAPALLNQFLLSEQGQAQIDGFQAGGNRQGLNFQQIRSFCIPLPPTLQEQQKIADCLSSIDALIVGEAEKLDALKDHKRGLMQQLFPAPSETTPRLRFPEFQNAGEWDVQPLGGLLQCPPTYGANAAATPYDPNLPTYLRITDISEDGRFIHENKTSVNIQANAANSMQHGDIALTRTGASVGKAYLHTDANGPLVFAGFLIRVRPNSSLVLPEIIFQFLSTQNYWSWVEKTSTRSGQPGINSSEYASLEVPLPKDARGQGMLEQQRIAAFLSSIDTLITALGDKIDALKAHKKGLMQQLFPVADEVQV